MQHDGRAVAGLGTTRGLRPGARSHAQGHVARARLCLLRWGPRTVAAGLGAWPRRAEPPPARAPVKPVTLCTEAKKRNAPSCWRQSPACRSAGQARTGTRRWKYLSAQSRTVIVCVTHGAPLGTGWAMPGPGPRRRGGGRAGWAWTRDDFVFVTSDTRLVWWRAGCPAVQMCLAGMTSRRRGRPMARATRHRPLPPVGPARWTDAAADACRPAQWSMLKLD